jgi:hypothetical protein
MTIIDCEYSINITDYLQEHLTSIFYVIIIYMMNITSVILFGGSVTRLWPLSI